jgi:hypothetical protein
MAPKVIWGKEMAPKSEMADAIEAGVNKMKEDERLNKFTVMELR